MNPHVRKRHARNAFFFLALTATMGGSSFAEHEHIVHGILAGNSSMIEKGLKSNKRDLERVVHMEQAAASCPGMVDLTPLQAAACVGDVTTLKRLIELHANLENGGVRVSTPLVFALASNHENVAMILLDAGASANCQSSDGMTALIIASNKGERTAVEKLLRAGANVKQTNKAGRTALLAANDPVIARMLVAFGSDKNPVDRQGVTGLHLAAYAGNLAMIDFWLEAGVAADVRDGNGMTPLAVARMGKPAESVQNGRTGRLGALTAKTAPAPSTSANSAVIARLSAEISKLLKKDLEEAAQAGKDGNPALALTNWGSAVRHAGDVGPGTEDETLSAMQAYLVTLPSWPGVSEEVREHAIRAQYMLGKGKNPDGAIRELHLALAAAPWWTDGYHDLGILEEGQGNHEEAKRKLNNFLALALNDPRGRAVRDKIIEINMIQEQEGKVSAMAGSWTDGVHSWSVSIRGDSMTVSGNSRTLTLSMHDGALEGMMNGDSGVIKSCSYPAQKHPATGTYDAEKRTIALNSLWSSYEVHWHCVNAFGAPSNCCLLCSKECDPATLLKDDEWHAVLHPAQQ